MVNVGLGSIRHLAQSGVAKGTPPEVVRTLREMARKTATDPAFLDKPRPRHAALSRAAAAGMAAQSAYFPQLLGRVKIDT